MMNINNIKKYFKEKISLNRIKLTAIIVSILLLGTFALPVFGGVASAQNYPILSGITYLNIPEKTFGEKTTTCKLTVTNFDLNKNEFTLKGILSYSNRNYPISIQGTLYKSRIGKDNFVALAKDTTNNFNVLHFSILFHPDKHFLVTKKIRYLVSKQPVSKTNNPFPIITIYLQRKNTREISFVEGDATDFIDVDSTLRNIIHHFAFSAVKNTGPFGTDIFLQEFLRPMSTVKNESDVEANNVGEAADITRFEIYEENYSADNYNVTLHIRYKLELEGTETYTAQQENREQINVLENYTITNTGGTSQILYNEPFSLGKPDDPVEFDNELITPAPYDVIQEYILEQYGANYGGSYLPNVAFSISTPFGIEINLIESTSHSNELFNLSQSEIEGQYDGEAFKTDLKTYEYWLNAPDSEYLEHITFALCGNPTSNTGYRYLYVTVPIYTTHYDGFGVTFSYRTTYGTALYFEYLRKP